MNKRQRKKRLKKQIMVAYGLNEKGYRYLVRDMQRFRRAFRKSIESIAHLGKSAEQCREQVKKAVVDTVMKAHVPGKVEVRHVSGTEFAFTVYPDSFDVRKL